MGDVEEVVEVGRQYCILLGFFYFGKEFVVNDVGIVDQYGNVFDFFFDLFDYGGVGCIVGDVGFGCMYGVVIGFVCCQLGIFVFIVWQIVGYDGEVVVCQCFVDCCFEVVYVVCY